MTKVLVDPSLEARFAREGYVAVPLLDPEQVAALLAELAELRPADGFSPDGSGFARNTYHCSFLDTSKDYKRSAFDLLTRHFAAAIDRHLAGFRVLSASFYIKQPGQGDLRIHQNWPVLELAETSVTVWCPLVDVDERNGTLHLVPASHKLVPHVEGPASPAYFSSFIAHLPKHMTPLPALAGDGFIFDDSIVHGSPPNLGTEPRIAVQLVCIPESATPVFFFKEGETRFERIAADRGFYLDHDIGELVVRQPGWCGSGHIENRNRLLSEQEFVALLAVKRAGRPEASANRPGPLGYSAVDPIQRMKGRVRRVLSRMLPARARTMLRRLVGRAAS